MGHGRTDEFPQNAVRIALTSGQTRPQGTDDLGVGMSTLSRSSRKISHSRFQVRRMNDKRPVSKIGQLES